MSKEKVLGRLYGIAHSNRKNENLWGKNQFNSTFPAALSCYMRDKGETAVYVASDGAGGTACLHKDFDFIFNTNLNNDSLFFGFEAGFEGYSDLVYAPVERVDVVVSEAVNKGGKYVAGSQLRALEVKLTVVPDNGTARKSEKEWAPELVIRPATTKYCALSMANSCRSAEDRNILREIFENPLSSVKDWSNEAEASSVLETVLGCLVEFDEKFSINQIPLVLQPIWKTKGKSPILSNKAFDIFVWSNFALMRLIVDQANNSVGKKDVSRPARSALRLARFMLEFAKSGKGHIDNIYSEMTYGYQNDKDFAVAGLITRKYLSDSRMENPLISRDVVEEIILDGGRSNLSPERRFDQSIYFAFDDD